VNIAGFVPDLMDRSRVAATAAAVVWVKTPGELAATPADLVIVDLSRPGVLDAVAGLTSPVVGFASHVDRELLAAAKAAGCRQVLARSAFFSRLPEIVGGDY
jgi:hypothetical protein